MSMAYQWRQGSRFSGDPQLVGETLERIRETTSGLTPENVVQAARRKDNPLHGYFTWNNDEAARLHRKEEARLLIRSVTVTMGPSESSAPVRAFVAVGSADDKYLSMQTVLGQPKLREQMLTQALAELRSFQVKYETLSELTPVWVAVNEVQERARC